MPKFKVTMCRTGYGFATYEVSAPNLQKAREKAFETAGNYDYSEKSSDYGLQNLERIKHV
jgi:hypothetical protein